MIFFEVLVKELVDEAAAFETGDGGEFFGNDCKQKMATVTFFVDEGDLVGGVREVGAKGFFDFLN